MEAVPGNTVSLLFTTSETIQNPTVTIGGTSVTATNTSGNDWVATYNVTSADPIGRLHFSVSFSDLAGNTNSYNDISSGDDLEVVSPDATLSALTLDHGVLHPSFNPATLSYTTTEYYWTKSINVTPTADNANATITVNGTPVTSGSPSTVSLNVGNNTINIAVTAQDGETIQTYTITATRAQSSNDNLAGLTLSSGTISPAFSQTTTAYNASVANNITTISVKAVLADTTASMTINGMTTASKTFSAPITLNTGNNVIPVVITAQDGSSKTYNVTVTRAASTGDYLAGLTTSTGTLSPSFSPYTNAYSVSVSNLITSIQVKPTLVDTTGNITVNGTRVNNASYSQSIPLNPGANTITTVVTAQDGTSTRTYTLTVNRAAATNAYLAGLALSRGTLNPSFNPNTTAYTASVDYYTSSIQVKPKLVDTTATITVNGTAVANGSYSSALPLNVGSNTINVVVTAQDGSTTMDYTVTVNRAASSQAQLAYLKLSNGTLNPSFSNTTYSYTAAVTYSVFSITVTPTLVDNNGSVTVNGAPVTSGAASSPISLNVGSNTITVVTTAQDGTTTKTYTIVVTRSGSSQALLSKLHLSKGTLNPKFANTTYNYTESVGNSVSSLTVAAGLVDPTATMKVNGTPLANNDTTASIPLSVGDNTITINTKAQDSVTTKTYTVVVTRAGTGGSSTVFLPAVTQTFRPDIAENVVVHQAVSPNGDGQNDVLKIDNIESFPDNNLQIMNQSGELIYQAKGYDNASKVFDGHGMNGHLLLQGTYFYSLDYKVNGEAKHKTGYIVLKY